MADICCAVTAFVYDTLLTFPSEVRCIWQKKFQLGTILYILARYATLLELLLSVFNIFATIPSLQVYLKTCNAVLHFTNALGFLPEIGVQGLLFARAYAISSHKKVVFVVLSLLGTIAIVCSMVAIPINNCISSSNLVFLSKMFYTILRNILHDLCFTSEWDPWAPKKLFGKIACPARYSEIWVIYAGNPSQNGDLIFDRFVLTMTLASSVTERALRPSLQGILSNVQNFLSTIIICHFHLDLQQRNNHPNGSNTSHSLPLGSFHAVTERIHRAVVDEFGDLSFNESFGTEGSQEDIELQAMHPPSGVAEIDLQEFPWAGGDIGDEDAGPVASGSGILRE
ncbi:hypothetical protein K439DRAFT_1616140 [Ramaria rubella]|nr:hypothetical protein K439DRAFT_1616140 [Ramaria rubella]